MNYFFSFFFPFLLVFVVIELDPRRPLLRFLSALLSRRSSPRLPLRTQWLAY